MELETMGREETVRQAQRKIQAWGRNRDRLRPTRTEEGRDGAADKVRQRQAKKEKQRER